MGLQIFWFIVVAVLWTGFFVLEGFDFGVGFLHGMVGRTDDEKRVAINAIGPFWDGNEVWLITAGAAIFAAFPSWYATLFSAGYLVLVLILVALIVRGVSFEYRAKRDSQRWRSTWSLTLTVGSLLAPLLLGTAIGDLLAGLPIDQAQEFTGSFWDLLTPYGLWVGITLTALCALHGATFLGLKTTGVVHERAGGIARALVWPVAAAVLVLGVWTLVLSNRGVVPGPLSVIAVLASVGAAMAVHSGHEGRSFAATAVTMAASVGAVFAALYPNVMVSTTSSAYNLTVANTASGSYALKVMTIVALVFMPLVLAYQAWSYYSFRQRVVGPRAGAEATPAPTASAPGP
jgi:cytochrome bd ubiquinol oxidase subunit II